MLADNLLTRAAQRRTKDERHKNHIVKLTRDRNEVGDEIEREGQVDEHRPEKKLSPAVDPGISKQPPEEN
jgi:hypothetical protein